jgi:hypothetical protein
MTDEPIVYVYRGEDRFYGVPRRSLTQADFDALTASQQADVIASKSYVQRSAEPAPKATTSAKKAETGKEG